MSCLKRGGLILQLLGKIEEKSKQVMELNSMPREQMAE